MAQIRELNKYAVDKLIVVIRKLAAKKGYNDYELAAACHEIQTCLWHQKGIVAHTWEKQPDELDY